MNIRRFLHTLALISIVLVAHGQEPFRVAMIGCHRQFDPAPALVRYVEAKPDLCLWIGDNVYADTEDDFSFIEKCYTALANKPAFQELKTYFPTIATWDDHDFGWNDAGKEYPLKEESMAYFRTFWSLEDKIPVDQDGIYYSHYVRHGDRMVQFIMLDVRYNRDLPFTHGDVLGDNQWSWLEAELRKPADLRFIASGFQVLLGPETGSETWAAFPEARERLFETVRRSGAQQVLFLTGDQHYGEVCRMRGAMDYDAVELQFSGINQIEEPEYNPWRVAPVIKSLHSYALIDLYLEETKMEVPHVLFHIYDALTNERELTYRVNLNELQTEVRFFGADRFVDKTVVTLEHDFPALHLRVTTDGSEPRLQSEAPPLELTITETTTVKAALFHPAGQRRSPVFERTFTRLLPKKAVALKEKSKKGLAYRYYEKQLEQLDDLKNLAPLRSGVVSEGDYLDVAHRADSFALVFEGFFQVPAAGTYTLISQSDDGSRIFVHNQLVVDNDGSHSSRTREGVVALEAGWHPIRMEYFDDYSGERLRISIKDSEGGVRPLQPLDFVH